MPEENINIDNIFHLSLKVAIRHRLPWLGLGLFGGILASGIVGNFEEIISKNLVLAAFIPLIVYMSDAVGTQMESFAIRDFALHKNLNFFKYFFLFVIAFHTDLKLAFVISVSMFFSIISSVITGLLFPRYFNRHRLDPANASGPIATITQDILSIVIYFTIASAFL
ncbi:MAG: Mg2+ transporter [Candidatus Woesebacteria bacterium GW2011_GWB1_38_8b]|uniref:Mg2+ transporter n=1 Tax=Candidatus Woesebacteria bacterium GW2011_GWB1_38_8b TaxID=1618571 RepID=A0A0G0L7E6_9BACT|nr:MAG: Mg2+ transporter [Candidatus Woesebacteria bacterium GW2011_GWB1_38_8b]